MQETELHCRLRRESSQGPHGASDRARSSVVLDVSNFFFWARWLLAAGFGLTAIGMAIAALANLLRGDGGDCLVLLFFAAVLGVPAWAIEPGLVSPREHARRADEAKATEASAEYQLGQTRAARAKLANHLANLEPLQKKYEREHAAYLEKLGPALKKAGVKSHRELLERGVAEQETANMLHRAAVLERALPVLARRTEDESRTLSALAQKEWELEHMIELEAVASRTELDEVRKVLAHAEALVDERTGVPEKQDVAELEASLFDRLLKGR